MKLRRVILSLAMGMVECQHRLLCPVKSCAVYRLLTSAFLLAHLMAQDLIRQAPAMLIRMQSSPALLSEAAPEQPDRRASVPSASLACSLAGD